MSRLVLLASDTPAEPHAAAAKSDLQLIVALWVAGLMATIVFARGSDLRCPTEHFLGFSCLLCDGTAALQLLAQGAIRQAFLTNALVCAGTVLLSLQGLLASLALWRSQGSVRRLYGLLREPLRIVLGFACAVAVLGDWLLW